MSVSIEEIKKISNLSMLHFEDDGLEKITREMEKIIKFAGEINEIAASNKTLSNVNSEEFDIYEQARNSLRDDTVHSSFEPEEIFENVKNYRNNFFYLKNSILKN